MTILKENVSFGDAIEAAKQGQVIARSGWNGKNMYLFYVHPEQWSYQVKPTICNNHSRLPFIAMCTATGAVVPWLASQTDVLANDWTVLEPAE